MSVIQKLPEHVINQIKAGEVVERPSSVVKELVENSIDAEATEISIELLDGGKQLIRITDNGTGIAREEIPLALERHATSKLRQADDLEHIGTLGFRGEALPSIAAVSRFSLASRQENENLGLEISCGNGNVTGRTTIPMPRGTVVTVAELFSNIPARLKFLRATTTEFAHISDFVFGMALAYPNIHFRLNHNGREVYNFPATDSLKSRFTRMLQSESKEYAEVCYERGSFRITGFAGLPQFARNIPRHFVTFVNGRLIKDRVVRAGILQAYSGLVVKGLLPAAILFVEVDPGWVDVNASPAKTELRFYDSAAVQDLIAIGVQNAVKAIVHDRAGSVSSSSPQGEPKALPETRPETDRSRDKPPQPWTSSSVGTSVARLRNDRAETLSLQGRVSMQSPPPGVKVTERTTPPPRDTASTDAPTNVLFQERQNQSPFSTARFLGQYASCYLIFETGGELWVVDQHAFHERILFEEFMVAHLSRKIPRQELLTPLLVPVPPMVAGLVGDVAKQVAELGFRVEPLKNGDLAVHSFPAFVEKDRAAKIFDEILIRIVALSGVQTTEVHPLLLRVGQARSEIASLGIHASSLDAAEVYHLFFATMACHSAVRAGEPLSEELVRRLMNRAGDVDFYAHCPHGRPVLRKFTAQDVGNWFLR